MTPDKRHLVGCYMYDYGNNQEMPLDKMKMQCEKYHEWVVSGMADGLVLCSNCCADVGFKTVEWTREWIAEIGNENINIEPVS